MNELILHIYAFANLLKSQVDRAENAWRPPPVIFDVNNVVENWKSSVEMLELAAAEIERLETELAGARATHLNDMFGESAPAVQSILDKE